MNSTNAIFPGSLGWRLISGRLIHARAPFTGATSQLGTPGTSRKTSRPSDTNAAGQARYMNSL